MVRLGSVEENKLAGELCRGALREKLDVIENT